MKRFSKMNEIHMLGVDYIRGSRTVETILLKNGGNSHLCYVYNYEGGHFRMFEDLISLIQFFCEGKEAYKDFMVEEDLEVFLENTYKFKD